jgi:signal transduction histidine kinase
VAARIRTRFALATGAAVLGTAALVLGAVYLITLRELEREARSSIRSELASLLEAAKSGGTAAVIDEVERRSASPGAGYVYLVAAEHYERIAGNVRTWPGDLSEGGSGDAVALEHGRGDIYVVRSYFLEVSNLDDGRHLLVGRDAAGHADARRVLETSAVGALGIGVLFAVAAGLSMSRNLLGRLAHMHDTIQRILAGQRDGRVDARPQGDEFDELAGQFNQLLDENERLVAQVREVTNNIAHDLRTPLARMHGRIQGALAERGASRETQATLEALAGDVQRMLDTFNGLLQIARVESRDLHEHLEPIDVDPVVRDVVDLYAPSLDEASIALELCVPPGLRARADRHLLAQALANLVDNALKYAAGGRALEISARADGERVELVVADRGPGIAAADRERVVQRLVRLDASRALPGTGLGLAFVAAVARLHRGELRLEDNTPGLRAVLRLS